jgi:15-cis-phytoene synthase
MKTPDERMRENYAHCESLVREQDRDRYIASLFAPAERRPHLHALYAFEREIALLPQRVNEALAGEMRLQWWRDALAGEARGDVNAHPVAAALLDTVARCALPPEPLNTLINARALDLYDDPLSSLDELATHARQTASTIFEFAARVLDRDARVAEVAGPAGVAATLAASLQDALHRDLSSIAPADVRAGARDALEQARRHWAVVSPAARPAFLTLALIAPLLARSERSRDPAKPVGLSPWRRQWLLWRAARRGAF